MFQKTQVYPYLIFGILSAAVFIVSGCLQSGTLTESPDNPEGNASAASLPQFFILNGTESESRSYSEESLVFIYDVQLSKVQKIEKWTKTLKIKAEGNPTEEDLLMMNTIIEEFNTVDGFPGMSLVESGENVLIIYAAKEDLQEIQRKHNLDPVDKGICRRTSENGEIKQAIIVIESDIDQDYKNSVVLHEMFHMIGFYGHSNNDESIINRKSIPVGGLSVIDTAAFRMLYDSDTSVGMDYTDLKSLYRSSAERQFRDSGTCPDL